MEELTLTQPRGQEPLNSSWKRGKFTVQTAAILPLVAESKTIVFGSLTGTSLFRDKFNPYVFNVRASYANEATATIKQVIQIGVKKVAVFYQVDGLGNAINNETKKAAK